MTWNCGAVGCSSHYVLGPTGEQTQERVQVLGTVTTGSDGSFTKTFTVPSYGSASYPIGATGSTGDFATTPFSVTSASAISVSPSSSASGASVTVSGTGFYGPSQSVTLYWNCATASCAGATNLGTVTTDGYGNFSQRVTIPANIVPGGYTISALPATYAAQFATTPFTVN